MGETAGRINRKMGWGIWISVICVAAIFLFVDPNELLLALKNARLDRLALSVIGIVAFTIIRSFRWRYLLKNTVNIGGVFHVQNIGYLLSNILPFRIGDPARVVMIGSSKAVGYSLAASSVVVERILDLIFFVALLPFTLSSVKALPDWMRGAALTSAVLSITSLTLLVIAVKQRRLAGRITGKILGHLPFLDPDEWSARLERLLAGLESFTHPVQAVIIAATSILVWVPMIFSYHLALQAVGIFPTWSMTGFVLCAAAFSVAAPSAPGQIGVFHAGVIAALTALAQPAAEAAGFAFLFHACTFVTMSSLGAVGLARTGFKLQEVVASIRSPIGPTEG